MLIIHYLISLYYILNSFFPKSFFKLCKIEASWSDMSVQRFNMPSWCGEILQGCIKYYSIYSDMSERIVIRSWWTLTQKITLAIPEYDISASPANGKIFPESGCQRRFYVVIENPVYPSAMGFASRVRVNCLAIEVNITTCLGSLQNK